VDFFECCHESGELCFVYKFNGPQKYLYDDSCSLRMTSYSHKKTKSKILADLIKSGRYKTPLKRSLSGYEVELCLVDEHGSVSHDSEKIIADCKKISKKFPISREVGKNMIEVAALPSTDIHKTALYFLDNIHQ